MSQSVAIVVGGGNALDLNGKEIPSGSVILQGTLSAGLTTGDLVVALRSGRVVVVGAAEPAAEPKTKRQPAKASA